MEWNDSAQPFEISFTSNFVRAKLFFFFFFFFKIGWLGKKILSVILLLD